MSTIESNQELVGLRVEDIDPTQIYYVESEADIEPGSDVVICDDKGVILTELQTPEIRKEFFQDREDLVSNKPRCDLDVSSWGVEK